MLNRSVSLHRSWPAWARPVLTACLLSVSCAHAMSAYYVGNSLTDNIDYGGVAAMMEAEDVDFSWGRHMIPGAPLDWLWDHNTEGFCEPSCPPTALPTMRWDHLTLQVCVRHLDSDAESIKKYVDLAVQGNPAVQAYIYVIWPDVSFGDYTTQWNREYVPGSWDNSERTADYFYQLLARVREDIDYVAPIRLVPVGFVMYELEQRMKAGEVPGYATVHELYADNVHLANTGEYVAGLTMFTTLTGIDPRGKAVPAQYGSIDQGLVAAIQNVVWDVLTAMSDETGVQEATATVPAQRRPQALARYGRARQLRFLLNGATAPSAAHPIYSRLPQSSAVLVDRDGCHVSIVR